MRILFVAQQLYLPQLFGGVQTSTDEFCHALKKKGHRVSLLVKMMPGGLFGWYGRAQISLRKRLVGCGVSKDCGLGYPVWRAWFPVDAINYVCKKEKPDLIVIMSGGKMMPLALAAKQTGIPILVQLHDIAFEEYGEDFRRLGNVPYIANSYFCAQKYADRYGITAKIINPFISTARYHSVSIKENVTFINPVMEKGCHIAIDIARRCPEIPFVFVEGWPLSAEQRELLNEKLRDLKNVTLLPSQRNMRAVYEKCKVLLVPSVFPETFGRVTAEAQINAIPVVASTQGGLPESVGVGGVLLPVETPIEDWVQVIRKLWSNDKYYAELSQKALGHAQRKALDHSYQLALWDQVLQASANNP